MSIIHRNAERPAPDRLLTDIADYVLDYQATSEEARNIARYCLMDTLGCGFEALEYPACTKMLGRLDEHQEADEQEREIGERHQPQRFAGRRLGIVARGHAAETVGTRVGSGLGAT